MGYRLDRLSLFYHSIHVNILIIDYRGYGSSTGSPSERGLELDAEATLEYALKSSVIDPGQIIIYGKSLGGAVAAYLAEKYQQKLLAVILENTFTHMGAMVDQHATHLKYLKPIILRSSWPSLDRIKKLERPILFIYGEKDEIINCKNMLTLYENAGRAIYKQLHMVSNGDHNTCYIYGGTTYLNIIGTFIQKVTREYPLAKLVQESTGESSKNHIKSD